MHDVIICVYVFQGMHDVIAVSKTKAEMVMETLEELVLGHIVSGSLTSSVLEDEQLLQTANDKESSIRINYFNRAEQVFIEINFLNMAWF